MIDKKSDSGFTFTGPLAIILGVIIFFLIVALLIGNGTGSKNAKIDKTKIAKVTTPININSTSNNSGYVEIPSFSIKINDPESRGLLVEVISLSKQDTVSSQQIVSGIFVRDNNQDFFNRCKYPVGIKEVSSQDSTDVAYTKKINDKIYYVGLGSSENTKCNRSQKNDVSYIDNLRRYVFSNLTTK